MVDISEGFRKCTILYYNYSFLIAIILLLVDTKLGFPLT